MSKFSEHIARLALAEVGNKEEGGNNIGPAVVKYQKSCIPTMYPGPYPWCAAFACYVFQGGLSVPEVLDELKITPQQAVDIRPREVGVYGLLAWAHKYPQYLKVISRNKTKETDLQLEPAKQGDIVIFDFQQDGKDDHVGVVVSDQESITAPLHTVEGNTGLKDKSDSNTGDGVAEKFRNEFIVSHLIRWIVPQSPNVAGGEFDNHTV